MKKLALILVVFATLNLYGQESLINKYQKADSLFQIDKNVAAFNLFKQLEKEVSKEDSLYDYVLWKFTTASFILEEKHRMAEEWELALEYGNEALSLIDKGIPRFNKDFAARKYWMIKNVIVSNFGLGNFVEVKKLRDKLYDAYNKEELPRGIDEYYNFEFFKWNNLNIWGYEWFADIPKDRLSTSFTKIIYYVYSTNPDGTDKEQLFRLHVLMFHKIDESVEFDYVLTRIVSSGDNETSSTLYDYTYKDPVDFEKLKTDIREVLRKDPEPAATIKVKKKKKKH